MSERFVSRTCNGEKCNYTYGSSDDKCGAHAEHKVEEAIAFDDWNKARHPFTAYLCHHHFCRVMGLKGEQ